MKQLKMKKVILSSVVCYLVCLIGAHVAWRVDKLDKFKTFDHCEPLVKSQGICRDCCQKFRRVRSPEKDVKRCICLTTQDALEIERRIYPRDCSVLVHGTSECEFCCNRSWKRQGSSSHVMGNKCECIIIG